MSPPLQTLSSNKQDPVFVEDGQKPFVARLAKHPKPEQQHAQSIEFNWRQIYILPNIRGVYYLMTLIIMFVWSVNYGLSLGYLIMFFASMLFIIVMIMSVRNLADIKVQAMINQPFFANAHAFFDLKLSTKSQGVKFNLCARRNGKFSNTGSVSAHQSLHLHLPLHQITRGCHQLKYVHLSSSYPMDLFKPWVWLHFDQELIIYPEAKGDLPIPYDLHNSSGLSGGQNSQQGSDDFSGIRNYQQGDSLKHVIWRRAQGKYVPVKEFKNEQNYQCILDFNHPQLASFHIEDKLSQLCQWVLEAEAHKINYELRLPNKIIKINTGLKHQQKCLEALAKF